MSVLLQLSVRRVVYNNCATTKLLTLCFLCKKAFDAKMYFCLHFYFIKMFKSLWTLHFVCFIFYCLHFVYKMHVRVVRKNMMQVQLCRKHHAFYEQLFAGRCVRNTIVVRCKNTFLHQMHFCNAFCFALFFATQKTRQSHHKLERRLSIL